MPYIYTISHPFTNEVVYVGCTKNIKSRAASHCNSKNESAIANWIRALADQFILPKIDTIEVCESEDMLYLEGYWINQLQQWGFKLLNVNNANYFKKTKERVSRNGKVYKIAAKSALRIRNSRRWDISTLDVGNTFTIPKTTEDRRILTASFKNYCRKFYVIRYLKYEEVGNTYVATVVAEKDLKPKPFGITKGGTKRYKPLAERVYKQYPPKKWKVQRYSLKTIKTGDTIEIDVNKKVSFGNILGQYNKHHTPVYFNYEKIGDKIICTCVSEKEYNKKGFTKEQVIDIYLSNESIRDLSKRYDTIYSNIWNIKNHKRYTEITATI